MMIETVRRRPGRPKLFDGYSEVRASFDPDRKRLLEVTADDRGVPIAQVLREAVDCWAATLQTTARNSSAKEETR